MRSIEINDYNSKGLTAKIDFKLQLMQHEELTPILGRYEKFYDVDEFGETRVNGNKAAFPIYNTGYYAFIPAEEEKPVGFISIIDDRSPGHFTEVCKLQHLWIDRKYSGKGYGNRLLEIVCTAILNTDKKCKSGELKEPCFSICLFPRRFDIKDDFDFEALVDGESEYDVSVDETTKIPHGIKMLDDVMITEFDPSHLLNHRQDLGKLVEFYMNRGFVKQKIFEIKTQMSKSGNFYREIGVMGKTFCSMVRTSLVFPACNNQFWDDFSKRMIQLSGKHYSEALELGLIPSGSISLKRFQH